MGNHVVISAAEVERRFPELLRAVEAGQRVTIKDGEKTVAALEPAMAETADARRTAWANLKAHLDSVEPVVVGAWSRDEIWDEITR